MHRRVAMAKPLSVMLINASGILPVLRFCKETMNEYENDQRMIHVKIPDK